MPCYVEDINVITTGNGWVIQWTESEGNDETWKHYVFEDRQNFEEHLKILVDASIPKNKRGTHGA